MGVNSRHFNQELTKREEGDLHDLLDLTHTHTQKEEVFIIGDWKAKVGSQELPGVAGSFDLE